MRIAMALVGFTLPFEYTTIIPVVSLTPNKLVTALLLALAALQFAAGRYRLPRDPKRPWVLFFGVALTVGGIQSVLAGVEAAPVRYVLATVYSLLLFYLLMTFAVRQRQNLDLVLRWFAVGSALAVLSGWVGYGAQVEGARIGTRLAGEGSNPNLLAFNLLVAISGAAALYFSTRARAARVAYLGLIAIMTAGVVGTLSRSAYVALPVMGLLWGVRFRSIGFLKYAAPGVLLVVAAALLAPESAVERLSTLTPDRIREDSSALGRFQMFPDAFRAFASNPITGVGLVGYIPWAVRNGTGTHGIHSAFLQVLAEHGLLGFVPFMAIVLLAWRQFTRAWRLARRAGAWRDPELRLLELRALLLQIGFAGALVMSLAQPSTHHKSLWLLFALATAVLELVRERARALAPAEAEAPPGWEPRLASPGSLAPSLDAGAT
jgi:O-antigen ligase